jgi:hypothetical protein
MKILNYRQGHRAAGFLRLCLCTLIALTLAVGGLALDTTPAHAIGITATPPVPITVAQFQPFSIQFAATGAACAPPSNPYFWFWPALPAYATLDHDTGLLTGCPKAGDVSATFFVGVSEFSPPFCGPFANAMLVTINVVPGVPVCNMVIDPTFYWVAWEGLPYSMTLSVTGGVGPYSWSATGLPAGLSVTDPAAGIISGIPGPATCGIYTVTATVADLGTCGCLPVSRPFIFIVDCWANYPAVYYFESACDFKVGIGPGLTYGQTSVTIDGEMQAPLAGGASEVYTSIPCESHVVMVDQYVPGPDATSRFAVKGTYYKTVTEADNFAYFDYAQEVVIDTASEPVGVAHPPGAGFYAVGSNFSSTAPSPVLPAADKGAKYIFKSWSLPDGGTNINRDLVFTVSKQGTARAVYDTYYLLELKSDYPPVDESSWEIKDSTAKYNLALQPIPLPNFWGVLGAVNRPLNPSGSHLMTGPYTQAINWAQDYTVPIIIIVVAVLVILGLAALLIILLLRKKPGAPAAPPAAATQATQPARADPGEKPKFCTKCGFANKKDAAFCKECGNKLD